MSEITVVGGGIAGLVAAIACAEGGASVRLLEAHEALGGRGVDVEVGHRSREEGLAHGLRALGHEEPGRLTVLAARETTGPRS